MPHKNTDNSREEDLKLIQEFRSGNEAVFNEICRKYNYLMHSMIGGILLVSFPEMASSDEDVFMQEATMALYSAVENYDTEQNKVTFGLYAKICIKNRLVSLKRRLISKRKKENKLQKEQAKPRRSREASLPSGISFTDFTANCLSDFERQVLELYVQKFSYKEIAQMLGISEKSADNAIYRIRRKFKDLVSTERENVSNSET